MSRVFGELEGEADARAIGELEGEADERGRSIVRRMDALMEGRWEI